VRELENTIERLVIMCSSDIITSSDLPVALSIRRVKISGSGTTLEADIQEIERTNILSALEKTGGIQARAARLLGITPRQIGYKIKKYGLEEKVG
jgi:Nif-specific regulatory protein